MSDTTTTKRKPVGKDISTRRRVAKTRRHFRLRKKISGTPVRPRMVVKRSSRHITVQVIDDLAGHTLASASTLESDLRSFEGDKKAKAAKVGELVASRAKDSRHRGRGVRPWRQRLPRPHRRARRRRPRGGVEVLMHMLVNGRKA